MQRKEQPQRDYGYAFIASCGHCVAVCADRGIPAEIVELINEQGGMPGHIERHPIETIREMLDLGECETCRPHQAA
ncbi:hypothetical protein [Arhodomonas sp. AD133]|uniref:hypothetical protein n=1 Tax=Arhodomonas sp. AD133 TaxID=3415009 RepID=UPI003EBCE34F